MPQYKAKQNIINTKGNHKRQTLHQINQLYLIFDCDSGWEIKQGPEPIFP